MKFNATGRRVEDLTACPFSRHSVPRLQPRYGICGFNTLTGRHPVFSKYQSRLTNKF
jgi:hypothetical protein